MACFVLSIYAATGCSTPSIPEAAPRGATSILDQLDDMGGSRTYVLADTILGSEYSLMPAFLDAMGERSGTNTTMVESKLLPLIMKEYELYKNGIWNTRSLSRLGELMKADTVIIGWGEEQRERNGDNVSQYTSYLHLIAVDIPSGCVIASWSYYPATARAVSKRLKKWLEKDDIIVVQSDLNEEVQSALLVGLHRASEGHHKVAVRHLLYLVQNIAEEQASGAFRNETKFLELTGATAIVAGDDEQGENLRVVDVETRAVRGGLSGKLCNHIRTSYPVN